MSDIWFVCKKTDKVLELADCLKCEEPKNCLSRACYQQGRADEKREIAESNVFFSNRPIEDIVLEARADAIDECLSLVEHALKDTSNIRYDWCVLWRKLWKEFEQLKGEQNERNTD